MKNLSIAILSVLCIQFGACAATTQNKNTTTINSPNQAQVKFRPAAIQSTNTTQQQVEINAAPAVIETQTPPPAPAQAHATPAQTLPELPEGIERTLSIIKPDAVDHNHIGDIISRFERGGLKVVGAKMVSLTPEQAKQFYAVHRERPFFNNLVDYMTSGPVVILVLQGKNAIGQNRFLMGKTDPQQATPGTIRADFGESISRNAVHGSDAVEAANEEILFFFQPNEIVKR